MTTTSTITEASKFEWNVFEQQFLDWHHTSIGPLSPESMHSQTQLSYEEHSTIMVDHSNQSQRSSSVSSDSPTAEISTTQKAPTRRRIQNRKAQRAFRARQKQHVESLEDKLTAMMSEYEALQERYNQLRVAYEVVATKEESGMQEKPLLKNPFETQQFDFEAWGIEDRTTGSEVRDGDEKDAEFEIDAHGFLMEGDELKWSRQ